MLGRRDTSQYNQGVGVPSHQSLSRSQVQPQATWFRQLRKVHHLASKMNSTGKDMSQLPEVVTPPPSDTVSSVGSPHPDYKHNLAQPIPNVYYSTPSPMQAPPQQGPPPPAAYAQPTQMYPQHQQSFQGNPEQYAKARARTAQSKGFCGGILAALACCCCLDYCCCC